MTRDAPLATSTETICWEVVDLKTEIHTYRLLIYTTARERYVVHVCMYVVPHVVHVSPSKYVSYQQRKLACKRPVLPFWGGDR